MVRLLVAFLCVVLGATSAEAAFISPTLEYSSFSKSWETTYFVQPGDPLSYSGITCVTVDGAPAGSTLFLDGVTAQCADYRFGGLRITIRAPADFTGAVTLTFIATLPTSGVETARRTFGGFVAPPPPPPPTRTLRVRAATWDGSSYSPFEPAAGAPVPATATVPLGATMALETVDSEGTLVPASFQLGTSELEPGVDGFALHPGAALIAFSSDSGARGVFHAVHLGAVSISIAPADASLASSSVTVSIVRPTSLGLSGGSVDADVVQTAHRTGVPPQFIKAQVWAESVPKWNRFTFRYEPLGLSVGELNVSLGQNLRTKTPYADYRLATTADSLNQALPQGTALVDEDRDSRFALVVGCDQSGQGGTAIGRTLTTPNPTAWEIFRCNDRTNQRMNWSTQIDSAEAERRVSLIRAFPALTAQTTLASSYGLLQVTPVAAIERDWQAADGRQNPSLLFDTPEAVALEANSLLVGTRVIRAFVVRLSRLAQPAGFAPQNFTALMDFFVPAWGRYNGKGRPYGTRVAQRVFEFFPISTTPVLN